MEVCLWGRNGLWFAWIRTLVFFSTLVRCSLLMILSDPEHFWFKNHYFSARAPNCLVYVLETVQNLKIHVFRKVPRAPRFLVNILRFF